MGRATHPSQHRDHGSPAPEARFSRGSRRRSNCAGILAGHGGQAACDAETERRVVAERAAARRSVVVPAGLPKVFAVWLACCSLSMLAPTCQARQAASHLGGGGIDADDRERGPSSSPSPSPSPSPEQYVATYGCPNCLVPHDVIRQYTLDEIKDSILSQLGFRRPPNVTNRLPVAENALVSKFMTEMGKLQGQQQHLRHRPHPHPHPHLQRDIQSDESQLDDEDDDRMRNTHTIVVPKSCFGKPYCRKYKTHYPLIFVLEQKTTKTKLLSANLSFYQRQLSSSKNLDMEAKVNVTIFKSTTASTKSGTSHHYTSLLTTEEKLSQMGRWIEIDIREHLEKHFKENSSLNFSLVIIATHPNKEIISKLVTEIKNEEEPLYPLLQIRTDEQRSKRSKRSNHMDCKDGDKYTRCCRYPLLVDFEAFQWDFIIAPRKYDAYYCAGECGPLSNQKYAHTHLSYMAAPSNNTHHPIIPCCGPRKMGPISMVFYGEDGNIHYGILPGMVVHRCGCA